jgi:hypothetical protein
LKILSQMKNDIAYDIVSYIIIGMREHKRLFCAYTFIGRFVATGKNLSTIDEDPVT